MKTFLLILHKILCFFRFLPDWNNEMLSLKERTLAACFYLKKRYMNPYSPFLAWWNNSMSKKKFLHWLYVPQNIDIVFWYKKCPLCKIYFNRYKGYSGECIGCFQCNFINERILTKYINQKIPKEITAVKKDFPCRVFIGSAKIHSFMINIYQVLGNAEYRAQLEKLEKLFDLRLCYYMQIIPVLEKMPEESFTTEKHANDLCNRANILDQELYDSYMGFSDRSKEGDTLI